MPAPSEEKLVSVLVILVCVIHYLCECVTYGEDFIGGAAKLFNLLGPRHDDHPLRHYGNFKNRSPMLDLSSYNIPFVEQLTLLYPSCIISWAWLKNRMPVITEAKNPDGPAVGIELS